MNWITSRIKINFCYVIDIFIHLQEIDEACKIIDQEVSKQHPMLRELLPIPLYPEQIRSFNRPSNNLENGKRFKRRVILTTNAGDSLLCIRNVKFVIDVGMERRKVS